MQDKADVKGGDDNADRTQLYPEIPTPHHKQHSL
jgi:hypothetical protein